MKKTLFITAIVFFSVPGFSQSVGIGTTTPNSSALLDLSSSSKGILMPRMSTAQRNDIISPAVGLAIFNTDDQCTDIFDGTNWIKNCGLKQTGTVNVPANTWIQRADFGGILRQGAVGFSIGGKGYIGTGYNGSYLNDLWEYDTLTNSWQQKANVGATGRGYAIGFAISGKGYIGTGRDPAFKTDFWEYDPVANSWTQKTDFSGSARAYAAGFSSGTKGYIATGYNGAAYFSDLREYDPLTNSWSDKPAFPGAGLAYAAAFSISGKGYVGTGYSPSDGFETDEFWEFNPATNIWTKKANFQSAFGSLKRQAATGLSIGNKGYIGTGSRVSLYKDFWEYDPVANTWTQRADFGGTARYFATGFSIGNKGYIGTGSTGGPGSKDFWEYNQSAYSAASYSSLPPTVINAQVNDGIWTKNYANDISSPGNRVTILGNGNVGIGNTSPAYPLSFPNSLNEKISLYTSGSGQYGLGIQSGLLQIYNDAAASDIAFGYGSSTAFTEKMRIKGNGNVGIGTSTPTSLLNVNGQVTIDQKNFGGYGGLVIKGNIPGSNYPNIAFTIKNTGNNDIVAAMIQGDLQNATSGSETIDLTFLNSQAGLGGLTEKMRIKSNGNIGIGTVAPNAPLQFANTVLNRKLVLFETANNDNQYYGLGINSGMLRYQVDAVSAQHAFYAGTGAGGSQYCFAIHGDGNIFAPGTFTSTSDARLKKNIIPLDNSLEKIIQLNGYTYNWISQYRDDRQQIGLLAQEVQKIYPQLVTEFKGDNNENTLGINYLGLIPVLIEAMKEQSQKIAQQQKQIDEQRKMIDQLLSKNK